MTISAPASRSILGAGLMAAGLLIGPPPLSAQATGPCDARVVLRERTARAGLLRHITGFGHAVADVDNDGDDDLVVSNHGAVPSLYVNQDGRFVDRSSLLPIDRARDRHGVTVADLDGDGDRDVVIAGGGGGSNQRTNGLENQVFRNLLIETGELDFALEPAWRHGISFQTWRGRHLLPLPSVDGSRIDLLFLVKRREGKLSRYLKSWGRQIRYFTRPTGGLEGLYTEGLEVPLDFNRDGRMDLLVIFEEQPRLLANRGGRFERVATPFDDLTKVTAAAAGDLDRDGYPEIYLGTRARIDISDQLLLGSGNEIHFLTSAQEPGDSDSLTFLAGSDRIFVDLVFLGGLGVQKTETVFIGRQARNPESRAFSLSAAEARGQPPLTAPGIYLWADASDRWHVHIRYAALADIEVGRIKAPGIRELRSPDLEVFPVQPTRDHIYRNLAGADFEEVEAPGLDHGSATRSVTMVDLDSNGWLDVAILRGAQWGSENGRSVLLTNCGGLSFGQRSLPNPGSRIFAANNLTYGMLDNDALPDLFLTNGWGPAPGNRGPQRLLINQSPPVGDSILLELVGSRSNRDAIGAQVELIDDQQQLLGYRLLAYRGLAQDSRLLHFGLGDHTGPVRARIHWPSGLRQTTRILAPNRVERIPEAAPSP